MKRWRFFAFGFLALLSFAALVLIVRSGTMQTEEVPAPEPLGTLPEAEEERVPPQGLTEEERDAALAAYSAPLSLGDRVAAFDEDARRMRMNERREVADALLAETDAQAAEGLLVADQPLFMKMAIYRALYHDNTPAMTAAVRQAKQEREEALAARPPVDHGPLFETYKQREAEILAEVMEMRSYPDGLTREQYLARRLAEVRAEIYTEE